jgi:hypothetical protein
LRGRGRQVISFLLYDLRTVITADNRTKVDFEVIAGVPRLLAASELFLEPIIGLFY